MKKLSLFLLIFFFLCSCIKRGASDLSVLILGIESAPKSLDPRDSLDLISSSAVRLYTQSLVRLDKNYAVEGDLAEKFDHKDFKIFKFSIHTNAVFHDGSPVTSEDVRFSFENLKEKGWLDDLKKIKSISLLSDKELSIELHKPSQSFLEHTVPTVRIISHKYASKTNFSFNPIGSGPFKFTKRVGSDWYFERFEPYKTEPALGRNLSPYRRIILRVIPDARSRFMALRTAEIDINTSMPSKNEIIEARSHKNLKLYTSPSSNVRYIAFNLKNKKFQSPKVREALALAINRSQIIEHKLLGLAQLSHSILPPAHPLHHPSLRSVDFNKDLAKKRLKEAGVGELSFNLLTSTNEEINSIQKIIIDHWADIGVKVSLEPYEWGIFYEKITSGRFEAYSLTWNGVSSAQMLSRVFHSKEAPPGRNRGAYSNPNLDRILEKADSTLSSNERQAYYLRAQEIIQNDIPIIHLWHPDNVILTRSAIQNLNLLPSGSWTAYLYTRKVNQ